ncbi:MFS transporter [Periweissella ghanensis]|uniref:Staphyloferrin B transporter n=1 Tax=Periweissella ghanensis TaxID=467997 RepID=A0ABN8BMI8_9LACO|nr:MFS transporter [Periweissella ghanensis]MCM0600943.1 MFS transporter [Periweissella ghanensis]CAH0417639.1 Staphyloferrin B transporter [Periweissella ghanensis]
MQGDPENSKGWHRTFITCWLGCFITGMGFSMTMPFLPLFIGTLGQFSRFELNLYAGIAFSITFLAQAIISPLWGNLADLKGRKLMCLRASGVMAFTIFATGLATSVWMVIILRTLQGLFSGYINNATALMAGETGRHHSGSVMAKMMTANVSGNLLGPLFGGALADLFGYRVPFFVTGILMAVAFVLTIVNVKEHFTPIEKQAMKPFKELMHEIKQPNLIFTMFATTMIVQSALMSISPIIALFVNQLMHGHGNVSLVSGVVAAMPGFGTLLVAGYLGRKMDKIGPEKILVGGLILAILSFVPMIFVSSPWSLASWRFVLGMANAGLLPAVQTILTLDVPRESFGRIFSYNQGFQSIGGVVGPLLGAGISGALGYAFVFVATALLLAVNLGIIFIQRQALISSNQANQKASQAVGKMALKS